LIGLLCLLLGAAIGLAISFAARVAIALEYLRKTVRRRGGIRL